MMAKWWVRSVLGGRGVMMLVKEWVRSELGNIQGLRFHGNYRHLIGEVFEEICFFANITAFEHGRDFSLWEERGEHIMECANIIMHGFELLSAQVESIFASQQNLKHQ